MEPLRFSRLAFNSFLSAYTNYDRASERHRANQKKRFDSLSEAGAHKPFFSSMVRLFTVEAVSRPVQWKGYGILRPYLSLRVENRPSVLGIFIYVPWGGVGWGNNVHVLAHSHDVTPRHVHLHVRTIAHIRHATLKMCHVTQGWGGVG